MNAEIWDCSMCKESKETQSAQLSISHAFFPRLRDCHRKGGRMITRVSSSEHLSWNSLCWAWQGHGTYDFIETWLHAQDFQQLGLHAQDLSKIKSASRGSWSSTPKWGDTRKWWLPERPHTPIKGPPHIHMQAILSRLCVLKHIKLGGGTQEGKNWGLIWSKYYILKYTPSCWFEHEKKLKNKLTFTLKLQNVRILIYMYIYVYMIKIYICEKYKLGNLI